MVISWRPDARLRKLCQQNNKSPAWLNLLGRETYLKVMCWCWWFSKAFVRWVFQLILRLNSVNLHRSRIHRREGLCSARKDTERWSLWNRLMILTSRLLFHLFHLFWELWNQINSHCLNKRCKTSAALPDDGALFDSSKFGEKYRNLFGWDICNSLIAFGTSGAESFISNLSEKANFFQELFFFQAGFICLMYCLFSLSSLHIKFFIVVVFLLFSSLSLLLKLKINTRKLERGLWKETRWNKLAQDPTKGWASAQDEWEQ